MKKVFLSLIIASTLASCSFTTKLGKNCTLSNVMVDPLNGNYGACFACDSLYTIKIAKTFPPTPGNNASLKKAGIKR